MTFYICTSRTAVVDRPGEPGTVVHARVVPCRHPPTTTVRPDARGDDAGSDLAHQRNPLCPMKIIRGHPTDHPRYRQAFMARIGCLDRKTTRRHPARGGLDELSPGPTHVDKTRHPRSAPSLGQLVRSELIKYKKVRFLSRDGARDGIDAQAPRAHIGDVVSIKPNSLA
jgi:hypothetical protein